MTPPHDRRHRTTPGRPAAWGVRLLGGYLFLVALACTTAPLFVHPDVNVLLALAQIPLALWAVQRHSRDADRAEDLTTGEEPWA